MTIKLTEKQLQIIKNIHSIKTTLTQKWNETVERETEFVVTLCEAKGVEAVSGIKFEDDLMIVPDPIAVEEPVKLKKEKK